MTMRLGSLLLLLGLLGCAGPHVRMNVLRDGKSRLRASDGLSSGERFSVQLQVPQDAYVYIARSSPGMQVHELYPLGPAVKLSAGKTHRIPVDGTELTLPRLDADEQICVVLSPHKIEDGSLPHCPTSTSEAPATTGRGEESRWLSNCVNDSSTGHQGKGQRPGEAQPMMCPIPVSPCAAPMQGAGPGKRALLIGIDHYLPGKPGGLRKVSDLAGARNDVAAVRALLKQPRFGFKDRDICVLQDAQATRSGIHAAIQSFLIAPTVPGDQIFFFFAGHGSKAANPLSREEDKRDETVVPSDANLSVPDLHDKELRYLFNQILDKGGQLVAAFDSCHSGSNTMSAKVQRPSANIPIDGEVRVRMAQPSLVPPPPMPVVGTPPHERGAVILSATQSDQMAKEFPIGGEQRGVFTTALVRALMVAPPSTSVATLLQMVSGHVQDWTARDPQLPGVLASSERLNQPLFGGSKQEGIYVAATQLLPPNHVVLDAGDALGLGIGAELVRTTPPHLTLRVQSASVLDRLASNIVDLTTSVATVAEGDAATLRVGDIYRVHSFGTPRYGQLSLWLGVPGPSCAELAAAASVLSPMRQQVRFVSEDHRDQATHVLRYRMRGWELFEVASRTTQRIGTLLSLAAVVRSGAAPLQILLDWPLAAEEHQNLTENIRRTGARLLFRDDEQDQADYVLRGELFDAPRYRFAQEKGHTKAAMPAQMIRTSPHEMTSAALTLIRLYRWLSLPNSPDAEEGFPYRMQLVRLDPEQKQLVAGAQTHNEEEYGLKLVLSKDGPATSLQKRYVYLCGLSSDGTMDLLYPRTGGNQKNHLPPSSDLQKEQVIDLTEQSKFETCGPPSIDSYVLLATVRPLANPRALCSLDQVLAPANCGGSEDESILCRVMQGIEQPSSQQTHPKPARWSIQRIEVRHVP